MTEQNPQRYERPTTPDEENAKLTQQQRNSFLYESINEVEVVEIKEEE